MKRFDKRWSLQGADPGLGLRPQDPLGDQDGLVAMVSVPAVLRAAQVRVRGRGLQLLLAPHQEGRVPVPQPRERLAQGFGRQRGALCIGRVGGHGRVGGRHGNRTGTEVDMIRPGLDLILVQVCCIAPGVSRNAEPSGSAVNRLSDDDIVITLHFV